MTSRLPPADEACFIDANILYYSIVANPGLSEYSVRLMREIAARARSAVTLHSAVADAVHKVMFSEVVLHHQRPRAGLLAWLKKNPDAIKSLTMFKGAARQFADLPMTWLAVDSHSILEAVELSAQHGLMMNDALIVASMLRHGIKHLVTNDNDFDRVPGITVWKPR